MENNNNNEVSETQIMYTAEHIAQLHDTIKNQADALQEMDKIAQFRYDDATRWRDRYEKERHNKFQILNLVHDLFEEMLENDEDTLDTYEDKYDKFVEFGMEGFTKQVEFVVSYIVTVSGTASVPYGSDFSEFDSSFIDITVDEDHFNGQLLDECTEISMDIEVEERDRSRSWEVTNG